MDEVVTHAAVLQWLPTRVVAELRQADLERELATPPELRGWYTAAEAANYDGNLIEVTRFGDRESRFIPGR